MMNDPDCYHKTPPPPILAYKIDNNNSITQKLFNQSRQNKKHAIKDTSDKTHLLTLFVTCDTVIGLITPKYIVDHTTRNGKLVMRGDNISKQSSALLEFFHCFFALLL